MASKVGADSSLEALPENTKEGCCMLVLVLEALCEGRNSIHGTATCFPLEEAVLEEVPPRELEEEPPLELELPGLVELPVLELPGLVAAPLLEVPEEVPSVEVPPPTAPGLNESTAKSILPDIGLTIQSLMVPI